MAAPKQEVIAGAAGFGEAKINPLDVSKFKQLFNDERKNLVFLARTAETCERYEDMGKFMKALVEFTDAKQEKLDLTVEERNLLSVAYKNVVGQRRTSWRSLHSNPNDNKDDPQHKTEDAMMKLYQSQVETELDNICKEVLHLLQEILLKNNTDESESRVFYLKMAGDYYRYLAEFSPLANAIASASAGATNAGGVYGGKASQMYSQALVIADKKLKPTHPIRLGLALNYSVCFYEILKDKQKAMDMAKSAFDQAISKLDGLDDASYKDSTLILQLLRDNLTLWASDNQGGENIRVEDATDEAHGNDG